MILIALTPALGIITRYARDTYDITRLTHIAQVEKEDRPYTFANSEVINFRYNPPVEFAVPGLDGVGQRIGVID